MSADRKAAFETATQWVGLRAEGLVNPPADNLAAAFLEVCAELEQERELHIMQIAAISAACLMNTRLGDAPLAKDHPYWSPAYQDAIEAVGREMRERERAESAEQRAADLQRRLEEVEAVTIERCAKVCDARGKMMAELNHYGAVASNQCAAAIRALSAQPNAAQLKGGDCHEPDRQQSAVHDVTRGAHSTNAQPNAAAQASTADDNTSEQSPAPAAALTGACGPLAGIQSATAVSSAATITAKTGSWNAIPPYPRLKPNTIIGGPDRSDEDGITEGLELAAKIAFYIGKDGTLKHEGAIDAYKAIRAEIERRRNKA